MNVAIEYTGDCPHLNESEEVSDEEVIITCNDCNSTLNQYEGIWYE